MIRRRRAGTRPPGRLSTRAPLFLFLIVFPLLGLNLYNALAARAERENDLHEEAMRWLAIVETEQGHVFDEAGRLLDLLIDGGTATLPAERCNAAVMHLAPRFPSYLTVTVADADGLIRCSSNPAALGQSIADRPLFHHLRETGRSVVGVSAPSRLSGRLELPLARRLEDADGRFAGAAVGMIDIGWLEDFLRRQPLPPDSSLLVADRSGVVFARAPEEGGRRSLLPQVFRPLLQSARRGVAEIRDGDRRLITAWSPFSSGLQATLTILGIDRDARMVPVDRSLMRSLLLSGAVVLGAVLATALGLHRYLRYRERVEQALERAQEHLSLVLASVDAGVWEWDIRANSVVWSEGIYRLFGVDPGSFTPGFTAWLDRLSPEEQVSVRRMIEDTLANRRTDYRLEHRVLLPDGEVRWLLGLGRVFYDRSGEALRMVGLTVDITQTKETEEALRRSEQRYRGLVESQTDIVVRMDAGGRYTFVNDTACRVFGRRREALVGAQWTEFAVAEDVGNLDAAIERMNGDPLRRKTFEGRVRTTTGVRWYLWDGGPIVDETGAIAEYQAVGRDINDRKLVEQRLRLAKEEAERATASKSRFLAAASHDLRQPMQSLFLFAAVLRDHVDAVGREQLVHLERSLEALKGLLDSLLDVSKLDAGLVKPQIEEFPLGLVLEELDAAYKPVADRQGLGWSIAGCDGTVRSDRVLLARLLRNLVENALRYTQEGAIAIRCRVDGADLLIEVEDTGIGIPADQRDQIFEEFVQVGNIERNRQQGLGLGLAIVRRLARLLGCRIDLHSEVGKGSVFCVRVPRGAGARRPPPSNSDAGLKIRSGLLVLVIDDEILVLLGLQAILREWGCGVITATGAAQAVERLRGLDRGPDLILADYRLGGGRLGTEAVEQVRAACGRPVPAILLTGETGTEALREAASKGLRILHKPVTARLLVEALNTLTAGRAANS
ncbi:PAS domain S-box protein [Azospirillum thermophilum]|uniref:histidine kinase n=1 Tax=Azospirillum thermophilum TaxID=2202148 RepID=A0A2S2CUG6_9PROT|nr:PAS domain S-box protein [Azospirillum thermophilum]AWK88163.1 hypothetical protein DEW08_18750 [Azospirillum thermophilum]